MSAPRGVNDPRNLYAQIHAQIHATFTFVIRPVPLAALAALSATLAT